MTSSFTHPHTHAKRQKEQGVVLIISLFVLLAITLLAVSGMQTLGSNERMAGNFKDRQIAFQAGEAALRDAEQHIRSDTDGPFNPLRPLNFSENCANGLCSSQIGSPTFPTFTAAQWTSSQTFAYGSQTSKPALTGLAATPTYVIEYQGTTQPIDSSGKPCVAIYSLATRATGGLASTTVFLHSTYRFRSGACYGAI
jgi:type IV pilus assembly protein PilX